MGTTPRPTISPLTFLESARRRAALCSGRGVTLSLPPQPAATCTPSATAEEPAAVLTGPPVPLQIGIREKLIELLEAGQEVGLARALGRHCGSKPYLAALLLEGACRHGADGDEVEPVSIEQQLVAASLLNYKLGVGNAPRQFGVRPGAEGCLLQYSHPGRQPQAPRGGAR